MTDQNKLAEVRALAAHMNRLTRDSTRKVSPSAPAIIPITMIIVTLFALITLLIKLFMHYMKKRAPFGPSGASSPDIPTTPEDQTSMATTASMKTRGSLRINPERKKNKPPPVSLYQIKQKQSPSSSSSRSKAHRAAMKAIARAAKAEPNRTMSRESTRQIDDGSDDNGNDNGGSSPGDLSQRSNDFDKSPAPEEPSTELYAAASTSLANDTTDSFIPPSQANQPEVHIVQIRDLDVQHSQPTWSQTESEI